MIQIVDTQTQNVLLGTGNGRQQPVAAGLDGRVLPWREGAQVGKGHVVNELVHGSIGDAQRLEIIERAVGQKGRRKHFRDVLLQGIEIHPLTSEFHWALF